MADQLQHMKLSLKEAMQQAEHGIEERQKAIKTQLKLIHQERALLGAERRQVEDERMSIVQQQTDLDTKLAELGELRLEMAASAPRTGGWCCPARIEKLTELDVTSDMTLVIVSAVEVITVHGAGTHDVNGMYIKAMSDGQAQGEVYFRKSDGGKALYYMEGAAYGLPSAWYIADVHRGQGMYFRTHPDEYSVPLGAWQVFDTEDFSNPGSHPPPFLEVGS
mmetsp:Transcript_113079/g.365446  ORF Transcript_113079/g.365446 Transcript_113079/m.365446 type:complete len:221 (-) Transcript_113079:197-859(-)